PHPVVFEVSEAEGLATDELHFVVEAFGDAVVAAEGPHGGDLAGPGMERVAELHQLRQASLPQLVDGAEKAWRQLGAMASGNRALYTQALTGARLRGGAGGSSCATYLHPGLSESLAPRQTARRPYSAMSPSANPLNECSVVVTSACGSAPRSLKPSTTASRMRPARPGTSPEPPVSTILSGIARRSQSKSGTP